MAPRCKDGVDTACSSSTRDRFKVPTHTSRAASDVRGRADADVWRSEVDAGVRRSELGLASGVGAVAAVTGGSSGSGVHELASATRATNTIASVRVRIRGLLESPVSSRGIPAPVDRGTSKPASPRRQAFGRGSSGNSLADWLWQAHCLERDRSAIPGSACVPLLDRVPRRGDTSNGCSIALTSPSWAVRGPWMVMAAVRSPTLFTRTTFTSELVTEPWLVGPGTSGGGFSTIC
jgi:hypothetical protein